MIEIELRLVRPTVDLRPTPEIVAAAISGAAASLATSRPGPELWTITRKRPRGRYDLVDVMGRKMSNVPAIGPGANRLNVGQVVLVEYYDRKREKPFIRTVGASALPIKAATILGLWICPEAGPGLLSRSRSALPQMRLSSGSEVVVLKSLVRTMDESSGWRGDSWTDTLGLLLFSLGPDTSPTATILASLHAVWDDGDFSTLTGPKVVVTETALGGSAQSPVDVPIAVTRQLHFGGDPGLNRQQGYFFLHQLDSKEVCFTAAVDAGIVAFLRSKPEEQVTSGWATDSRRNGVRGGNVACVESFLCESGYSETATSGGSIVAGGARLQTYQRDGLAYNPNSALELGALVSGITGAASNKKKVFSVGILDPSNWDHVLLSTRWPMMAVESRREWWIYVNLVANPDPHWITLAVDAKTGLGQVVDDFRPDLSWKMLFAGLLASESGRLQTLCDDSRDTMIPSSNTPRETVVIGYEVDPGDPSTDPPTPPRVEEYVQEIQPIFRGDYYTGERLQSPFINVVDYSTNERFYAFPLPLNSAGEIDSGTGQTSEQVPAGVIDPETKLHFGICAEPQHYAYALELKDDVTINFGVSAQYDNDEAWAKLDDRTIDEIVGSPHYIWWITKAISIFTGEAVDIDPHLSVTTNYTSPDEDPAGNDIHGVPAGNAFLGPHNPVGERGYARKRHGEYVYLVKHRTWVTVSTPDKKKKFRADISKYYVDEAGANAVPQLLNIWGWEVVGDYLWILRQDYIDTTPDGDGVQTNGNQEPCVELWRVGPSSLTLLGSLNLHRTADVPAREWQPSYKHPPRLMVGLTPEGKPFATIWTDWKQGGDEPKHLVTEVLYDDGVISRSGESWDTFDAPKNVESANSVHHDGKLFWIRNGDSIVSKSST